jgi:hypothetical protein
MISGFLTLVFVLAISRPKRFFNSSSLVFTIILMIRDFSISDVSLLKIFTRPATENFTYYNSYLMIVFGGTSNNCGKESKVFLGPDDDIC